MFQAHTVEEMLDHTEGHSLGCDVLPLLSRGRGPEPVGDADRERVLLRSGESTSE